MPYIDQNGVKFSDDKKTLIEFPYSFKGEYIVPEGVTDFGPRVFFWADTLTRIVIPKGMTKIQDGLLDKCPMLTFVELPEGITEIEADAFSRCPHLQQLIIPHGVIHIGTFAFAFSGLKRIVLPATIRKIGEDAFAGCDNLKEIWVPIGSKARFLRMRNIKQFADIIIEVDEEKAKERLPVDTTHLELLEANQDKSISIGDPSLEMKMPPLPCDEEKDMKNNDREYLDDESWNDLHVESFTTDPKKASRDYLLTWNWSDVAECGRETKRKWRLVEKCHTCETHLIEVFVCSSPSSWDHLSGRAGLLTFCPSCQKQIRFNLEYMN